MSCRICYSGSDDEPLISPCDCMGSIAHIHNSCLREWLKHSKKYGDGAICEICGSRYMGINVNNEEFNIVKFVAESVFICWCIFFNYITFIILSLFYQYFTMTIYELWGFDKGSTPKTIEEMVIVMPFNLILCYIHGLFLICKEEVIDYKIFGYFLISNFVIPVIAMYFKNIWNFEIAILHIIILNSPIFLFTYKKVCEIYYKHKKCN